MATTEDENSNFTIGTILPFALSTNHIPDNWLVCDGSAIPNEYATLIDYLGNDTPDLGGKTLIGAGNSYSLGETGGEEKVTLSIEEMPSHQHFGWGTGDGDANDWTDTYSDSKGYYGSDGKTSSNYLYGSTFTGGSYSSDDTIGTNNDQQDDGTKMGTNNAHDNMQPFYTINYIIYAGAPSS